MSPATWFRSLGLAALLIAMSFVLPAWPDDTPKGKKYALLVGVTEYKGEQFASLRYTENDVEKLADILKQAGFDKVRLLSNKVGKKDAADAPTAANIKKAIDELVEDKGRRDTVLIALSGHGANVRVEDPDEKGAAKVYPYFCPHDASTLGISYSSGRSKFLVNLNLDLFDKLEQCGARNKLVLIDACRNELKAKDATRSLESDKVTIPAGVGVLFSCSRDERAWETEDLKHGVFFHFVIQGLRGKAKNDENEVTWPRLVAYVTEQVERQVPVLIKGGASQTPHLQGNVRGAPILVPAGKVVVAPKDRDKSGKEDTPGKEVVSKGPLDKEGKNSIGMAFKLIPKGTFTMGASKDDDAAAGSDESPRHKVKLSKDFYLQETEVTQAQFLEIMDYNPSFFSRDGKKAAEGTYKVDPAAGKEKVKDIKDADLKEFPVENVSYDEAVKFCNKLNEKEKNRLSGWKYSLPTEAQWEYACRGGATSYKKYHFGDSLSKTEANFNHDVGRTSKVGSYPANAFGLRDMHGNVWEWCLDSYDGTFYRSRPDPDEDPVCLKGANRVDRGGNWRITPEYCRSAYRSFNPPEYRFSDLGFRVALVPVR